MAHISGSPLTMKFRDLNKIVVSSFSLALTCILNSAHPCVVVASFSPSKDMLSPRGEDVCQQPISSSTTKNDDFFFCTSK